jgi:hypothetical protein
MNDIPGKLSGSHPLVGWLNRLRESVIRSRVTSVVGAEVSTGQGGTTLKVPAQKPVRIVYVKCCLEDNTEVYLPVFAAGQPFRSNGGTTTAETIREEDIPDGATYLA